MNAPSIPPLGFEPSSVPTKYTFEEQLRLSHDKERAEAHSNIVKILTDRNERIEADLIRERTEVDFLKRQNAELNRQVLESGKVVGEYDVFRSGAMIYGFVTLVGSIIMYVRPKSDFPVLHNTGYVLTVIGGALTMLKINLVRYKYVPKKTLSGLWHKFCGIP